MTFEFFKKFSLKTKLVTFIVSLTILMFIVSWAFILYFSSEAEKKLLSGYESHSINIGNAIAAQFYERYGDVQAFAINKDILSTDKAIQDEALNNYAALYGIYDLIIVLDTKGNIIGINNKDPDGKVIKVESLTHKNFAEAEWFKNTLKGQFTEDKSKGLVGSYVEDPGIDPLVSEVYGEKRIGNSFSSQIKNAKGEVIGVVTNRAGMRWIELAITEYYLQLKAGGFAKSEITMLNRDGVVIVDYDPSSSNDLSIQHKFDSLLVNNLKKENDQAALLIQDRSGFIYTQNPHKNITQATGFSSIAGKKMIDSLKWGILVRTEKNELLASIIKVQRIFYASMISILILAIFVSLVFSNKLSSLLKNLAMTLSENSNHLKSISDNVADTSKVLSDNSTELAAALQETVSGLEEISGMVSKTADNANESRKLSELSNKIAEEGKTAVKSVLVSMDEINESNSEIIKAIEQSNQEIESIVGIIQMIGQKTQVINDIVFQTRLLAFNASVEAARAGEAGKGFAVVAEEVGNLAQMSGNAAKEITDLLTTSIDNVQKTIERTKEKVNKLTSTGKIKVANGGKLAEECAVILEKIVVNAAKVNSIVTEITSATKEQAEGVIEINKAMNSIDQVTLNNTNSATETANLSSKLQSQANVLQKAVEEMFTAVNGSNV